MSVSVYTGRVTILDTLFSLILYPCKPSLSVCCVSGPFHTERYSAVDLPRFTAVTSYNKTMKFKFKYVYIEQVNSALYKEAQKSDEQKKLKYLKHCKSVFFTQILIPL